jgi:tetratricopeptide (TPR) repeat protein
VTRGYAAAEHAHHLTHRHELAQHLGDTVQIFYALVNGTVLAAFRLELSRAQDIARQLLEINEREHDPDMQLQAHGSLANVLWQMGDYSGALEHSEKALAWFAYEKALSYGNEHWTAACQFFASLSIGVLGYPDKGLRRAFEFLTWARERAQLLSSAIALNCVATILAWCGEGEQALKHVDAQLALTAEHGFANWHSFGQIVHGQVLALLGRADEAVAEIKPVLDAFEASGAAVPCWGYAALAFAHLAAKQPQEGLRVATMGLEAAVKTGNGEARPELHRLHGELLLMSDSTNSAEAATCFRAAIEMSRKQSAKWPELRATVSLARLLRDTDRCNEALTMLTEMYNWFTEGFDTADLKVAKTLLDELRS